MARIVLTGGGTGGHIYPALAIADGLTRRWPQTEIYYLGAENGMEKRIVSEAGYAFFGIPARGWQGRTLRSLLRALRTTEAGRRESLELLTALQPDAVVGTGGYVCLPVALAAWQSRIPVYIHEQNAFPGLANRIIAIFAKRIMLNFAEADARLPAFVRGKAAVTGLPVRGSIAGADIGEALRYFQLKAERKTILVTGGSQGASQINRAMLHVIRQLYGKPDVQILFASGRRDYAELAEELASVDIDWYEQSAADSNIRMYPYIDRMDLAYAAAHIFIGRAGASTLAEITLSSLPAILVPLPHAAENHQAYNAASLADRDGALVIQDWELTGATLLEALQELLDKEDMRRHMAKCSGLAAHGRALEDILDVLAEIADE